MSVTWERQEAGWYASEIGGINRESDGWCFFPKALIPHIGPFKTLKEAQEKACLHSSKMHSGDGQ